MPGRACTAMIGTSLKSPRFGTRTSVGFAMVRASQEQAALLLQDQAILREAEMKAQEMLDKAQAKAAETMSGADQYAADVLVRLESDLVKSLSIIKRSLEVIEERKPQPTEG